jgi:hypothetical protein
MSGNRERCYPNMNRERIISVMNDLRQSGLRMWGDNPWEIDTLRHGVRLAAEWREAASILAITTTNSNWYVSPDDVWKMIDPLMQTAGSLSLG